MGTGMTRVPEVVAVNEVTEGATPDAAAVPESAVPLLMTAVLSDAEAALSVMVEEALLTVAVAEVISLSVAFDEAVLSVVAEVKALPVAVVETLPSEAVVD